MQTGRRSSALSLRVHYDLRSELEKCLLLWLLFQLRERGCCGLVQSSLLRWLRVLLSDELVGWCTCSWACSGTWDYSGCGPSRLYQRWSSETSACRARLLLQSSSRRSKMRRLDLLPTRGSSTCQRCRQTTSMQDRLRLWWHSSCRICKLSRGRCLRLLRRRCTSLVMSRHHHNLRLQLRRNYHRRRL